jgi:hypothetical protein
VGQLHFLVGEVKRQGEIIDEAGCP